LTGAEAAELFDEDISKSKRNEVDAALASVLRSKSASSVERWFAKARRLRASVYLK